MSWLAYETLTAQPDFTQAPDFGLENGRSDVQGRGADWVAWQGHTDLTIRMDFKTITASEHKTFRNFLDRQCGRLKAFYLPSWRRDFRLLDAVVGGAGTTTIRVAGSWHIDNVTEARPDTVGRRIFIVSHSGVYADYWVESFASDGLGNTILTLDRELLNDLVAARSMVGLIYFVRLLDDDQSQSVRGICMLEAELNFRAITHTRRTEDDYDLT